MFTCFICRRALDPAARNLNVAGGWAMVPLSHSPGHERERVRVCLEHAGVKEEIMLKAVNADFERALDAWSRRELEQAIDSAMIVVSWKENAK